MYLSPRERRALIMSTGLCLAVIIAACAVAASFGALWCPAGIFC